MSTIPDSTMATLANPGYFFMFLLTLEPVRPGLTAKGSFKNSKSEGIAISYFHHLSEIQGFRIIILITILISRSIY